MPDIDFALTAIIVPALLADSLLIAALVYDWRTRGRPHKVYVIGGLCILGVAGPTAADRPDGRLDCRH